MIKTDAHFMNSRASAAIVLASVITKQTTLDHELSACFTKVSDKREQSFIQELCFGVMRWYPRFDFILRQLMDTPLKRKDMDIRMLIFVGLYQLSFLRVPEHAAISASVDATRSLKKKWASKLVNAVLRRYQREEQPIEEAVRKDAEAFHAHPDWLIKQTRQDWPEHWESILRQNNERPPMHLRVNLNVIKRSAYLDKLAGSGIEAMESAISDAALLLSTPVGVEELPDFKNGEVSIQDIGAQLATPLLDLNSPQLRILDACSAPGGKSAHILESGIESLTLTAIEKDERRIERLNDTLTRLKLRANVIQADASDIASWWDGILFDRILIDAPCSALGVIRRHPDIKMLREQKQIASLNKIQEALLTELWPLLKAGGRMLYSTCSIMTQENDVQIEKFVHSVPDCNLIELPTDIGVATKYGRQLFPHVDQTDGFYYAAMEKV